MTSPGPSMADLAYAYMAALTAAKAAHEALLGDPTPERLRASQEADQRVVVARRAIRLANPNHDP